MKHITIVTVDVNGLLSLPATCSTVKGDFLIAGYGYGSTSFAPGTMPNLVGVVSGAVTEFEAVMAAVKKAEGYDVVTVLKSGEYYPDEKHMCFAAVENWVRMGISVLPNVVFQSKMRDIPGDSSEEKLKTILNGLPEIPARIFHILPHVEDRAGTKCRNYSMEARTATRAWVLATDVEFGSQGFQRKGGEVTEAPYAVLPEAPILHQSIVAVYLDAGDAEGAVRLSKVSHTHSRSAGNSDRMERRLFVLARAEVDRRVAMDAFKILYKHYSFHEELWRLKEWMELLPYDLDESPEMEEYRRLIDVQIGHLKLGSGGPADWYSTGSPTEVTSKDYVTLFLGESNLMPRFTWLISECKKRGFKRVVEFGSVDGVSLFPLMMNAKDIEWHGVEVSKGAVAHGRIVAEEAGMSDRFHLHHANTFMEFSKQRDRREIGIFDAAAVFEVLEHNDPTDCLELLRAAEEAVRPGGRIYISTPCGNWSAHDESTRVYPLKKDHVNAFTEKRMRKVLKDKKDVFCEVVENTNFEEGNSNVHASYER